jgi:methylated-DNA-[protein]-cysteine S-methyltransferase
MPQRLSGEGRDNQVAAAPGSVNDLASGRCRDTYRVNLRHGVSEIRGGQRHAVGIIFHDSKVAERSKGAPMPCPPNTHQAYKLFVSPVGMLKLVAGSDGLAAILWENERPKRVPLGQLDEDLAHPILQKAETQLGEYFSGARREFSVPLDLRGTEFQKKVWRALLTVPFGQTRSYGEIARQIGNPNGSRAVGAANGRNPVSIIVPCHRAIGANGSLTGFAGGLETKRFLLALEHDGKYGSRDPEVPMQQKFDM